MPLDTIGSAQTGEAGHGPGLAAPIAGQVDYMIPAGFPWERSATGLGCCSNRGLSTSPVNRFPASHAADHAYRVDRFYRNADKKTPPPVRVGVLSEAGVIRSGSS